MKRYERGYLTVDLDAVVGNMKSMAENLEDGVGMIGIVKADGYGHGAVKIAQTISPYVEFMAVATADEAIILRRHGIDKPILVLGVTGENRFSELLEYDIRPTIFQYEKAEKLSKTAVSMGKKGKIHLAVDTGMSRIGMMPDSKSLEMVRKMSRLPGVELEGIFTHFSRADETDKGCTNEQYVKFSSFISELEESGIHIPVRHCANSAGIIDLKSMNMDMVRAGISIYGLYPSDEVVKKLVPLQPVMGWKSFVSYVKTVPEGTPVSYGGTFVTEKETIVATVPIGYADGYLRSLSGVGSVLIHGQRAPILGRICMDQMMADVSAIEDVKEGDCVTLIGKDGNEEITVEELAELSGGFHYEILCTVGKRIPRVYYTDGKPVDAKDYFFE
ncbi:alanine racemase [Clostridium sp. AM58-1XD]|nr:alanine racemase [Clostridium sp. AM58-1XD]RGZ00720.1 alanine racemase [Clostridium sp. AM58-1XD]